MSKLGEIIERFRKKRGKQIASTKNVFDQRIEGYSSQKERKFAYFILPILFLGFTVGGYFTVKIIEKFVALKKKDFGGRVAVQPIDRTLTKPTEASRAISTNNESQTKIKTPHTKTEGLKKTKAEPKEPVEVIKKSNVTQAEASSKPRPNSVVIRKKKFITKQEQGKPLFVKRPKISKGEHYSEVYSPQEGPPILREEGLLKNLLLNAEEEVLKGNYQSAKVFYEKYLAKRQDPEVYNNYGSVLFMLGDFKSAEKAYAKAFSLRKDPTVRLNLILVKLKLNQFTTACQMFREAQSSLEKFEEAALIKDICSKQGF